LSLSHKNVSFLEDLQPQLNDFTFLIERNEMYNNLIMKNRSGKLLSEKGMKF